MAYKLDIRMRALKNLDRLMESPLFYWRSLKDYTQSEAAQALGYKSKSSISLFETGSLPMPAKLKARLNSELEVIGVEHPFTESPPGAERQLKLAV